MAKRNFFTKNTPKEDDTQVFTFGTKEVKCTWESKDISLSRSSISTSVRFQRKIRSQDREVSLPNMAEMERFLVVVTLESLGNCKHKSWSPHHKSFQK